MPQPDFLAFTPVPLRPRHDGWSADMQRHFIVMIARGIRPTEAARALGMNRTAPYRLRTKQGAESFAAAWDSASAYARRARFSAPQARPPGTGRPSANPAAPPRAPATPEPDIATLGYRAGLAAARAAPSSAQALFEAALARALAEAVGDKGDKGDKGERK